MPGDAGAEESSRGRVHAREMAAAEIGGGRWRGAIALFAAPEVAVFAVEAVVMPSACTLPDRPNSACLGDRAVR